MISYFIDLEVDEFAHKSYDPDCEITRMYNIADSIGLPVVFLRYNPDKTNVKIKDKHNMLLRELDKILNMRNLDSLESLGYTKTENYYVKYLYY
jgi:hypothetical protein